MQAKQKAELEAKQKAEQAKRLAVEAEAKRKADAIASAKAAKEQRGAKQCATPIEIIDAIATGQQSKLPECKSGNAPSAQTGSPSSTAPSNGVTLNPNLKDIQSLRQVPAPVPAAQQSPPSGLSNPPMGCSTFSNPTPCPKAGPTLPSPSTNTAPNSASDIKNKELEERQRNPFTRQPTQEELAKDAADETKKAAAARDLYPYPISQNSEHCDFLTTVERSKCVSMGFSTSCTRTTVTKYCERKGLLGFNGRCSPPETTTEQFCK